MELYCLFVLLAPACTEITSYINTYTGISGIPGLPDISALTTVDGKEVYYYDSNIKKLISKQGWMNNTDFSETWKMLIEDNSRNIQRFKMYTNFVKKRFNQTGGVHTYQWMYVCDWNDETGDSHGQNMYGYDGEDLIVLNLKYTGSITSSHHTAQTHQENNDKVQFEILLNINNECVACLKKFLEFGKDVFKTTVQPEVHLLQRNASSPVVCLATGSYPEIENISWKKNGEDYHEDVETRETLPNEDGTFQKRSILKVKPEEWKKNQYSCVVQHKSLKKAIQMIVREEEIKTNHKPVVPTNNITNVSGLVVLVIGLLIFIVLLVCVWCRRKRSRAGTNRCI
ncbi:major histocompatibility complex class I-related gene protein-like [Xyrauchen texanus]|uniref:major histocompatibility complex class I-related gene protein-like n=1 Tax=Xyrauchen texanus TaxID=154827 RepID=UPI002242920B|nr:major histocompatibility complex class I-related gene protein-like [Xyrauchen texanus]